MEACVKRLIFLFVVIAILIAGGGLTAQLASTNGDQRIPGSMVQTDDPEASVFVATEWQAQQFFLLVGFLLFNLIGIGVTIAIIMWFLSRQVAVVGASAPPSTGDNSSKAIQKTE
jgi:hypothetical protein